MPEEPFRNSFLRNLDAASIGRLKPTPVTLDLYRELMAVNGAIKNLYFVEEGIASMTNIFKNGNQVEVGTFGFESVVGISAILGVRLSTTRVFMQMAGRGFSVSVATAQAEFDRHDAFYKLLLTHAHAQYAQATQNVACNAMHKYEQRMAKWLLLCSSRTNSDTLELSHEFLARMLGSTRSTITITIGALRRKGLIQHSRGCIRILDHKKLAKHACECYLILQSQLVALNEQR